ncbi:MAG: methylamine utilization protein [Chlorobiaceae bacterium]|nr:methylamine utilization protein [Chlorobiaceae bacterium]NTW74428.1 methylamine utilization protein [Chlorobiaceae bacterium]
MHIKSTVLKAAMLAAGFGFFSSSAFSAGTVTGTIDATMAKYKKDAVVYLKGVKGPIAPKKGVVDQKNLIFVPHVLAVPTGSTVDFKNSDKVNHNIFSADVCKKFNLGTYNPGMSKSVLFDKPCVVNLLCNVHSEMTGYVVVVDSAYYDVTDATGKFTIANVPAGTYEITAWSEKLKPAAKTMVTVTDGGTATVAIKMAK